MSYVLVHARPMLPDGSQDESVEPFRLLVKPGNAKPEQLAEVFQAMSELHELIAGTPVLFTVPRDGG